MKQVNGIFIICSAAILSGVAANADAVEPRLLDVVPADPLAVVFVDRSPSEVASTQPAGGSSLLGVAGGVVSQLRGGGLLGDADATVGVLLDVVGGLSALGAYPYAVVVVDANARPLEGGGHRLSDLQAAVVAITGESHDRVARQIQAVLSARTSDSTSRIERAEVHGATVYTLIDTRLPDWARVKWARFDDFYCIAIGERAFAATADSIAAGRARLSSDAWFAEQFKRAGGPYARIAWMVDLERIRTRLAPVMEGRVSALVHGLGLADAERGLWTVGRRGRAIAVNSVIQRGGEDRLTPVSRPLAPGDPLVAAIPEQADSYAIIEHSPASAVRRVRDAYLSSRGPSTRANLIRIWNEFANSTPFDVERDFMAHLGERVIIHTYPENPLKLPLLCTIMVEITGSPDQVRASLATLLTQCDRWLAGGDPDAQQSRGLLSPRLMEERGVWFLRAGIYGPGLTVADRWLLISFSPDAVRRCAEWIDSSTASNGGAR